MRTPFKQLRLVIYIGDRELPITVEPVKLAADPARHEAIVKLTGEQAHVVTKAFRDLGEWP